MKFSEQWLREWVNPAINTQQLAERLTKSGLEVDAVKYLGDNLAKVVVGKVIQAESHPNADKLKVCQVDVKQSKPLTIVCGAANARAGLKVAVALVGAELANGLAIKKAKIRDIESFGMLCSSVELGLSEDAEGILELADDAPLGESIVTYLQLDDHEIEIEITPNRGDCLSIQGIARDVSALTNTTLTRPTISNSKVTINDTFKVKLTAPEACPRYVGRIIKGVNNQQQVPLWLKERLRRSGIRSINAVVDITNYVMLELGQPMHAFDLNYLEGHIDVRLARKDEKIVLLDEQEVTLDNETLVIADSKKLLAMAGIMGGHNSGVQQSTADIFLESAYFAADSIIGKARRYGLHTDSSYRFERGVDYQLQTIAVERATQLILEICGGQAGEVIDVKSEEHLPEAKQINLRAARIERILGQQIDNNTVENILKQLGMTLQFADQQWQVGVPSYRFDIKLEIDLIEEVARVYGYDNLPTILPEVRLNYAHDNQRVDFNPLRQFLLSRGYQEAICYSFISEQLHQLFAADVTPIRLVNPITNDYSVMRSTHWPGLIRAIKHNINRQQHRLRLFEIGLAFLPTKNEPQQPWLLSGAITGSNNPEQWSNADRTVDFYDAKNDVQQLLNLVGITQLHYQACEHPALHPSKSVVVEYQGAAIGYIGMIHPTIAQTLELPDDIVLFELQLSVLDNKILSTYQALSKFPEIRRDLALEIDESISSAQIVSIIKQRAGKYLQNIVIFDIYQGSNIAVGKKSIAVGLILQHPSRTLIEQDITETISTVVSTLKQEFGALLRE